MVQPKPRDVVVQKTCGNPSIVYVLGTFASPGQFSFHDRDKAIRRDVGYAGHAHVGAWFLKGFSAAHVGGHDVLARNRRRIETVLNRIRPMLRADGLDVDVVDVWRRGASVHLTGASSWCQGAPLNFHRILKQRSVGQWDDLATSDSSEGRLTVSPLLERTPCLPS
jgi:Fe-S cluster biogenesis protein NfuA